jgi:hypothetical protein
VRLAQLGSVAYVDAVLLHYRLSDGQITAQSNRRKIAMDNLLAMEKVAASHPQLCLAHPRRLRAAFAERHLDLADAASEDEPMLAIKHVLKSARFGGFRPAQLRVLGRVLAPAPVLAAYRRINRVP